MRVWMNAVAKWLMVIVRLFIFEILFNIPLHACTFFWRLSTRRSLDQDWLSHYISEKIFHGLILGLMIALLFPSFRNWIVTGRWYKRR